MGGKEEKDQKGIIFCWKDVCGQVIREMSKERMRGERESKVNVFLSPDKKLSHRKAWKMIYQVRQAKKENINLRVKEGERWRLSWKRKRDKDDREI